jgi:hypothetical protein
MLAAGLLAGGAALMPASAADLGGSCCADLEERVAELEATTARKGNRRVSVTISGQVSTALLAWDSGDRSDVYVVDNAVSSTHFRLSGQAKINPNLVAGFDVAIQIDTGARSHQVDQFDDDGQGDDPGDSTIVMTRANWYLDHKHLGRVTLGRLNTATSGLTTIDLGGAGVIANASIGYWQRSFFISFEGNTTPFTWGNALGGNAVNGASLSRANAISYTSPSVHGFSFAAAWGENDVWDVALRYAGEFSGFRVAGGIGYISNSGGTNEVTPEFDYGPQPSQWKGSASILHIQSGLYLTGAYVNQDNDGEYLPNTTLWYLQGGVTRNWTGWGNTVLYAEYARVDDGAAAVGPGSLDGIPSYIATSEASMWGIGVVQHIDAAAMELFLSFRQYRAEADINVGEYGEYPRTFRADDFNAVMSGARIRF